MLKLTFSFSNFLCGLIVLFSLATSVNSDGGGRSVISPYSSEEVITVERVGKQKELARSSMAATFDLNGAQKTVDEVGIAWVKAGKVNGTIYYFLNGHLKTGESIAIDFSEIQQLSIVRIETTDSKVRALLNVSAFPTVSPEQLMNKRPTYSELKKMYSKSIDLWIDLSNSSGGALCFVGKHGEENSLNKAVAQRLQDFKSNSRVQFGYSGLEPDTRLPGTWRGSGAGIWWAIPSVFRDSEYPYRRPIMKS